MTPDPKAAEDFARLVLVTARTLRQLIQEPINPRRRAAMLTDLNDALQPFDAEPDLERHECGGCAPPVYTRKRSLTEILGVAHASHCAAVSTLDGDRACDCGAEVIDPDHTHDNCELPRVPGAR